MDEGENAEIEYAIIDGNDNRIFAISRGEQNQGLLTVERRLDREEAGVYLLTIKCFRPYEKKLKSQVNKYNSVVSFFSTVFFSFEIRAVKTRKSQRLPLSFKSIQPLCDNYLLQ